MTIHELYVVWYLNVYHEMIYMSHFLKKKRKVRDIDDIGYTLQIYFVR